MKDGDKSIGLFVVHAMFPEPASRRNVDRYYALVQTALLEFGLVESELQLVAYATIRAESASFAPIPEGKSRYNTLIIPVEYNGGGELNLYDKNTKKGADLGNDDWGDGARYMGRGFVQITGKHNYRKYGAIIERPDLVDHPELANEPLIAARLLAAYIDDHREWIETALARDDFAAVRKAVNGGSHGLAAFRQAYLAGYATLHSTPVPAKHQTRKTWIV